MPRLTHGRTLVELSDDEWRSLFAGLKQDPFHNAICQYMKGETPHDYGLRLAGSNDVSTYAVAHHLASQVDSDIARLLDHIQTEPHFFSAENRLSSA